MTSLSSGTVRGLAGLLNREHVLGTGVGAEPQGAIVEHPLAAPWTGCIAVLEHQLKAHHFSQMLPVYPTILYWIEDLGVRRAVEAFTVSPGTIRDGIHRAIFALPMVRLVDLAGE